MTSAAQVATRDLDFLSGAGEMRALMRTHDWTSGPLGPPVGWPQSLKTAVRIMLSSRFAMWMAWGPELTFFCNDAYRPTLGVKQGFLGERSDKVWAEIWPDIGPRIDRVLASGEATWDEALLLFLGRSGFTEESYHTFSYSPLADDAGVITGMLCVVTEETERVIGERRLRMLRDLGTRLADTRTAADVWAAVRSCLEQEAYDIPFALVYEFGDGETARLAMAAGMDPADPAAPGEIGPGPAPVWPVNDVLTGVAEVEVDDLARKFGPLPSGSWSQPPAKCLTVPIAAQGHGRPFGAFVAALNPFRPLDATYRGFVDLFVGQVAAALANAGAYEAERRRAEALAEVNRAKTAFFSNVSHEFRTPLTLMLGPLEDALNDDALPAAARQQLEVTSRNALRLLRLVNALLDFSRIEAGGVQASYQPTDLAALTADIASSFRSATDKAGLRLTVECRPLGQATFVDSDMWEKIVLNLVSNAFKFTFEGEIKVRLERVGHRARLTVSDTGTGIPQDELPRLFERFHRVEGANGRSFEGSGIGLALVQELVNLHGGSIGVESAVGRGTTFTVDVPLGSSHLDRQRVSTANDGAVVALKAQSFVEEALRWLPGAGGSDALFEVGGNDGGRPGQMGARESGAPQRVLIADDNADLRDYIARLLVGRGYGVAVVGDGEEALAAVRTERPDLLVTDVMMPRLDGFGLLRAIRSDAELRDLPVIMLSARAGEEAKVEGLDAGADDYLTKPFSGRELLARVAANLTMVGIRKDAAEAIRATEARSAGVLKGMAEAYLLLDPAFRVLQINDEGLRLEHRPASEILGKSYWAAWPGTETSPQGQLYRRAMAEQVPLSIDLKTVGADGRDAWSEIRAYPTGDGLAIFYRDIGDRKRADEALRRLNETLEAEVAERTADRDRMWKNSRDLLVVVGADGIFRSVNPAWTAILGYGPEELVGRSFLEFVWPDDASLAQGALEDAAAKLDLTSFENRYRHRDGTPRWISWQSSVEGDLVYAFGRHITHEKEQSQALARAEEQLRQSQKMEAVGALTGGIAHDFNNLLTVVIGNVDMARRSLSAGENNRAGRAIENAQKGAERAAALTQRLLAFSRRQPLAPKPIDVDRLVSGMADLLNRALGETVQLETVSSPGLWRVEVDPNQLESALLNLAVNARDAMPEGGKLTVEAANARLDESYSAAHAEVAPGQYTVVAVTDTGVGMSKETLARVFEPFFTTKEVGKGTGLGLSQVYGFVKQSGGHIKIYSEEGEGTTVKLYLPRLMSAADLDEEQDTQAIDRAKREQTVLVVEDDDDVRAYTVEILRELGYRVREAHDGPSALRVLARQDAPIQLLFTDVVMPGMSGRELADKARERQPNLKVLYTSGYTRNAIVHGGRLDNGVEMIAKPFTYQALADKISDVLYAGATNRVLVVEDNPTVRMFAVEALEGAGYAVDEAASGVEALNRVRANQGRYDAIVLDLRSPSKSGDALAVEIRALYADLPILLTSADHEVDLRRKFAGDRCLGVISKPYNASRLQAALDALGVSRTLRRPA